jgi:RNA polymerase sigma factor (sigma-70 family)
LIRRNHVVTAAAAEADQAVGALYQTHYESLVHLAALAAGLHPDTAEKVVQDAFVAMHRHWGRLRGTDKALSYLRRSVLSRSRLALQDGDAVVARAPGADHKAAARPAGPAVIDALSELPAREREALVLRYYAGLPAARTAKVMGTTTAAVTTHTMRGMSALRAFLEQQP